MTPAAALRTAQGAGQTGQFYVTPHALKRQGERSVTHADISHALASATTAAFQLEREAWRLDGGQDLDGDDLTVVVVFDRGVVVVTVF